MNEILKNKIKHLATGTTKEYLIDFLNYSKDQVADVRTKINVDSTIENEVRKAVIQVIDEVMISKLRIEKNPLVEPDLYN